jgi:hypothetical protein
MYSEGRRLDMYMYMRMRKTVAWSYHYYHCHYQWCTQYMTEAPALRSPVLVHFDKANASLRELD